METARACSNVCLQARVNVPQLTRKPPTATVNRTTSFSLKSRAIGRSSVAGFLERPSGNIRQRRTVVVRASEQRPSPPPAREDSVRPISVVDKDGKVEGVIQVEQGAASPQPTWGRIYALGAGDVTFLLLFAAIGRLSHGFSVLDFETVKTADPFIAGWLMGSYFMGGYGPEGQGLYGLKTASLAGVKAWAVGIPLALVIRGLAIGHVPPTPFMVVSLASTLVLQVGWRAAFTAVFPNDEEAFRKKMMGNKKGSVFDFFKLLSSLVRRW